MKIEIYRKNGDWITPSDVDQELCAALHVECCHQLFYLAWIGRLADGFEDGASIHEQIVACEIGMADSKDQEEAADFRDILLYLEKHYNFSY